METPQFTPETDGIFLGRYSFTSPMSGTHHDVDLYYFADNGFGDPTIMSRWGNHGAKNGTGMSSGWSGLLPDMVEARRRAEAKGLNVNREKCHAHNMPQRCEIVFYKGKPHTFHGIAHPKYHGIGVWVREGYPPTWGTEDTRETVLAPFDEVTDLDNLPVHWCQDLP